MNESRRECLGAVGAMLCGLRMREAATPRMEAWFEEHPFVNITQVGRMIRGRFFPCGFNEAADLMYMSDGVHCPVSSADKELFLKSPPGMLRIGWHAEYDEPSGSIFYIAVDMPKDNDEHP